tara:strand:- start:1313 stop:1705 length:393 start_codon:yes stop_codon:yes gene_type:complete
MATMSQALIELGISNFELEGTPTSKTEFEKSFVKITGHDKSGSIIRSTNPDDFGVTWTKVKAKYDELVAAEPLEQLREVRNSILAESDWTQNRDVTLSNDVDWKTYRQALRDITKDYKSLEDVKWPEKPE